MSEQVNIQTIQDIDAAFGRGDVPFIIDRLSDGVVLMVRFMGSSRAKGKELRYLLGLHPEIPRRQDQHERAVARTRHC